MPPGPKLKKGVKWAPKWARDRTQTQKQDGIWTVCAAVVIGRRGCKMAAAAACWRVFEGAECWVRAVGSDAGR